MCNIALYQAKKIFRREEIMHGDMWLPREDEMRENPIKWTASLTNDDIRNIFDKNINMTFAELSSMTMLSRAELRKILMDWR